MSVLIETSVGLIVIDLYTKECPNTTLNFLKLCKVKYYNNCIFHNVQKDLIVQTGDPSWTGDNGQSIFGLLGGAKHFVGEPKDHLTHHTAGTVSMAVSGTLGEKPLHGSQFFITVGHKLEHLDGKFTVIGRVTEGMDTVWRINDAYCDETNRPYRNIRIKHVFVLHDPFDDPPGLIVPPASPQYEPLDHRREADEEIKDPTKESEESIAAREALSRAEVLSMVGDLPDAEAAPPEEILFVCKLNPVTQEDDLEVIFSKYGTVKHVEIIKDRVTGKSLCYGFVEFEDKESCTRAYLKMDNALIDERRIHVDFCQSVAKVWRNRVFGVALPAGFGAKGGSAGGGKPGGGSSGGNRQSHHRDDNRKRERDNEQQHKSSSSSKRDEEKAKEKKDRKEKKEHKKDKKKHKKEHKKEKKKEKK